jgi:hypothetical protein
LEARAFVHFTYNHYIGNAYSAGTQILALLGWHSSLVGLHQKAQLTLYKQKFLIKDGRKT